MRRKSLYALRAKQGNRMDGPDDDLLRQAADAFNSGHSAAAQTLFRAVVGRNPAHAVAHHQLGVIALAGGDLKTAVEHLQYAAALAPMEPEFHNNLGVAFNADSDPAAARDAFQMAVMLNDGFAEAFNNLGAALEAT